MFRSIARYISCFLLLTMPILAYGQAVVADSSQNVTTNTKLFLDLSISPQSYKGDLSPSYHTWNGAFYIGLLIQKKRRLNPYFAASYGKISGANAQILMSLPDSSESKPNSAFQTSYVSLEGSLRYTFFRFKNIDFYISQGVGFMRFNTKDGLGNTLINNTKTRSLGEEYSQMLFYLPSKLGLKYHFESGVGLGGQVGFLNLMSDYIDNVSKLGNTKKDNIFMLNISFLLPLN